MHQNKHTAIGAPANGVRLPATSTGPAPRPLRLLAVRVTEETEQAIREHARAQHTTPARALRALLESATNTAAKESHA